MSQEATRRHLLREHAELSRREHLTVLMNRREDPLHFLESFHRLLHALLRPRP